jgi:hypothetical protein
MSTYDPKKNLQLPFSESNSSPGKQLARRMRQTESIIVSYVMASRLVDVHWRFIGKYFLLLLGRRMCQTKYQQEAVGKRSLWALSQGIKQGGRESHHSPPSRTEVKKGGVIPALPRLPSWHNDQLRTETV